MFALPWKTPLICAFVVSLGEVAVSSPRIQCEDELVLGECMPGGTVDSVLVVTNEGDEDLVLSKISVGCKCLVIGDVSIPTTIAPGKRNEIGVQMETAVSHNHDVSQKVYIQSNDPEQPTTICRVIATIVPSVSLKCIPQSIDLHDIQSNAPFVIDATLTWHPSFHTKIGSLVSSSAFQVQAPTESVLSPNQPIRIIVRPEELPFGRFRERIQIAGIGTRSGKGPPESSTATVELEGCNHVLDDCLYVDRPTVTVTGTRDVVESCTLCFRNIHKTTSLNLHLAEDEKGLLALPFRDIEILPGASAEVTLRPTTCNRRTLLTTTIHVEVVYMSSSGAHRKRILDIPYRGYIL